MKSSHDTLSRSDDTEEDERGGVPAHALHGGAAVRRTVEHVAVPMPPSAGERPPFVPIPNLPITIFSRKLEDQPGLSEPEKASTEEADEDDETKEQEERQTKTPRQTNHKPLTEIPEVQHGQATEEDHNSNSDVAEPDLLKNKVVHDTV